jgi:bisphosphoglycerate-dependent phosphoglycerate mutase
MAREDPEYYASFHRGYNFVSPEGESLEMVEKRVMSFLEALKGWLRQSPGNVAISCHNNSIRPLRRVFEDLSLTQMCTLESPQDCALLYDLELGNLDWYRSKRCLKADWEGVIVPKHMRLATDPQNPLKTYY